MESLFYNLLNNNLDLRVSETIIIGLNTHRKLYNAGNGSFVVVDRMSYGPEYLQKLGEFKKIPFNLGAAGKIDLLEIYLRSEADRLAEESRIGKIRSWANNWFQLLPFFTLILPPSFDANRMYDPIRILETPIHFPISKEKFDRMPLGSIRSYGLNGGIRLPIDLFPLLLNKYREKVMNQIGVKAQIPFALFWEGEHRINILKKSENIVWVGITYQRKKGDSLNSFLGNIYFLFKNSLNPIPWKGLQTPISPVDLEISFATIDSKNLLFEFDLNTQSGLKLYKEVVRGKFNNLKKINLVDTNNSIYSKYHFTKTKHSQEKKKSITNNLFVFKKSFENINEKSKVSFDDIKGTFHVLETLNNIKSHQWNILSGEKSISYKTKLVTNVNKATDNSYTFEKKNPYFLDIAVNIENKHTTVSDYNFYLQFLEKQSKLRLNDLPRFERISTEKLDQFKKVSYLANPNNYIKLITPQDQILGRMNILYTTHLSYKNLLRIFNSSETELNEAIKNVYEYDWIKNKQPNFREKLLLDGKKLAFTPIYLFNEFPLIANRHHEVENIFDIFKQLQKIKFPSQLQDLLSGLTDTFHPEKLLELFITLSSNLSIPKKITFFVKPDRNLSSSAKEKIKKINERTVTSKEHFPMLKKYDLAQNKLNQFFPANIKDKRIKLKVKALEVIKQKSNKKNINQEVLVLKITAPMTNEIKCYIKFQTTGKIHVGSYTLAEDVLTLKPSSKVTQGSQNTAYEIILSGETSPFSSFFYHQLLDIGGTFKISISISDDDKIWSEVKNIQFSYDNETLIIGEPDD